MQVTFDGGDVAVARSLVELRAGDALETLIDLAEPVDLLFLDGRNDLYLPVLRLVEPRLAPEALVAADLNAEDQTCFPGACSRS